MIFTTENRVRSRVNSYEKYNKQISAQLHQFSPPLYVGVLISP